MMGFKAFSSAAAALTGIEMVHMMRKRQERFAFNPKPTLQEQFEASPHEIRPNVGRILTRFRICDRAFPSQQ
jgi:hypothetical protein